MSDRKKGNTDNVNTSTTYIPQELREQYRRSGQNPQQNQSYPNQSYPNQSYPNQSYPNQSYPNQSYPNQPYPNQSYPNQSYPNQSYPNQSYPNQPYPNQSYPNQSYPNQSYPNQSYPNQSYPNQPYPNQSYPNQSYPNQPYPNQSYPNQPYPQPQPASSQPRKKKSAKKKKKHKSFIGKFIMRLFFILLIIFLLLFGIYSCTVYKLIDKMDYSETGNRIRTTGALSEKYVTNVLLIGTDGRTETERGRSDSMILLSVNNSTDTMYITSFMRDCYVEIQGYGWDKLNSAYSYGGAELLMDTIEHNFGIKLDDYISVNFVSFANIVDSFGGIDIEISDAEAEEINVILKNEVNALMGDDTFSDMLASGGKLHLNGKQALSYSRIRYVGNADFERTERQRRVMELALDKLKSFSVSTINNISDTVMPDVVTNMTSGELYLLSLKIPFTMKYDTQQLQIPADNTYYSEYTASGDSLIVDFDANYNIIKQSVFSE